MIKIEKTETFGWEAAIRGMRNPMNSWGKGDSGWRNDFPYDNDNYIFIDSDSEGYYELKIGPNDQKLMMSLRNAGTDHRKFMRMITVYCDITAPLYWWKEFDTYKVGTVANSCSTMHKIQAKEFTIDDFSHEHIFNDETLVDLKTDFSSTIPHQVLCSIINCLNGARGKYLETKNKKYWWQMIQLLPSSYNQKRTIMMNCEVLSNIYQSRKNHKLDEWHDFCDWIKTLPYSELITGEESHIPKRTFDKIRWDDQLFKSMLYLSNDDTWELSVECRKLASGYSDNALNDISIGIISACHIYGHDVMVNVAYFPSTMIATYYVHRTGDYNSEENRDKQ